MSEKEIAEKLRREMPGHLTAFGYEAANLIDAQAKEINRLKRRAFELEAAVAGLLPAARARRVKA